MPNDTHYDGDYVVVHRVQRGETLSQIAHHYKFKSYLPIWIYNAVIAKTLNSHDGPDKIAAGQILLIPRSEKGYKKLLKKLDNLRIQTISAADQELDKLEGMTFEYKAQEVMFDFAGDVATLVGSLGGKAIHIANLRREASVLKGSARFAKEIQLRKGLEDLSEAASKKELRKALIDADAQTADQRMGGKTGLPIASTFVLKTTPKTTTLSKDVSSLSKLGPELRKAIGLNRLTAFLDIADIALDYVKVSSVANFLIWVRSGETVEGSFESAKKGVEDTMTRTLMGLHLQARKIQDEFGLVYGKNADPPDKTYPEVPPLR